VYVKYHRKFGKTWSYVTKLTDITDIKDKITVYLDDSSYLEVLERGQITEKTLKEVKEKYTEYTDIMSNVIVRFTETSQVFTLSQIFNFSLEDIEGQPYILLLEHSSPQVS